VRARSLLVLFGLTVAACSPTDVTDDTQQVTGPTDNTLITVVSTVPSAAGLPAAVVDRLLTEIPSTLGVELEAGQLTCVGTALAAIDPAALRALGQTNRLSEQPLDFQAAVFGAFDGCVSPDDYGRVAAPILELSGASAKGAVCVFRQIRKQLGFAGMYTFGTADTTDAVVDPALGERVAAIYVQCGVDPTRLSSPTLPLIPSTSLAPGQTTTVPPPTTAPRSTVPGTGSVVATTVVPPVAPPVGIIPGATTTTTTVAAPPSGSVPATGAATGPTTTAG
jgi:hypothetical protein